MYIDHCVTGPSSVLHSPLSETVKLFANEPHEMRRFDGFLGEIQKFVSHKNDRFAHKINFNEYRLTECVCLLTGAASN